MGGWFNCSIHVVIKEKMGLRKRARKDWLSRFLSKVLRHKAHEYGIAIRSDGFVVLDDMLALQDLQGVTHADVSRVVEESDKKRFEMRLIEGVWYIRAVQGHSIRSVTEEHMYRLTMADVEHYPVVVHGTYLRAWELIKTQGLSCMTRNHIHLAAGDQLGQVRSGFRASSQVLIYIDLGRVLQDGIPVYRSRNDVLLTPGQNRTLAPIYFDKAMDVSDRSNPRALTW